MDLSNLLLQLGSHFGISELALNKNNVCCLGFEEGIEIFIEHDIQEQFTHLYTVLGDLPTCRRENFYEQVFKRNLFGQQTGRSVICCDIEQGEVLLCQIFNPYQLDGESFINIVDQFVNQTIKHHGWLRIFDDASITCSLQDLMQVESHLLKV